MKQVPQCASTNKTDRHTIGEILLKVALNTINQTNKHESLEHNIENIYVIFIELCMTVLLALKGNNSCKTYNSRIKFGNVQMMYCLLRTPRSLTLKSSFIYIMFLI